MFQFTKDCKIGIEQIDAEHEHLFDLLNETYTLATADFHSDNYDKIKQLLTELGDYAEQHFEHEETYMKEIRDPELILQRTQHDFFREKILSFDVANIDANETQQRILTELVTFLAKWLYRHILGSDALIGKLPPLEEWMIKENPCEFTDEYLVGIDIIDKEHRQLFHIVDKADKLIKSYDVESGYDKIIDILNELKEYTIKHFADEEEYMAGIGYDGLTAQKRAHDAFIDKINNVNINEIDANPKEYLQQLLEFLLGWLINHILCADKKIPQK